jgi:hypothetical protein
MVRSHGTVLSYLFRDSQRRRVSENRRAAVLSILRGRFWRLKGLHQGLLSAKPRGKSIRRAVFDVRNSTPADFHNARIESLNHDERLPVLVWSRDAGSC